MLCSAKDLLAFFKCFSLLNKSWFETTDMSVAQTVWAILTVIFGLANTTKVSKEYMYINVSRYMLIYCVSACFCLSHTDTDTHAVPKILLAVRLWDWDSSTRGKGGAWRAMSEAPPTQSPSASSYIRDFPRYWLPHGRSEMCHHAVHTHQQKLQGKINGQKSNGICTKHTHLTWL